MARAQQVFFKISYAVWYCGCWAKGWTRNNIFFI